MGAWTQAITQGLGWAGNEAYEAGQLSLEEKAKKLALLKSNLDLQELQQRMGMVPKEFSLREQEVQRLQSQFELERKLAMQPKFLGFQKVGGRVLYGLQSPDGTITTKEAEGLNESGIADAIESGIKQLPPDVQGTARAAVGMWLQSGDYDTAKKTVDQYLLQYGKGQMPGPVTVTNTTTTGQIDTPNGPMLVQIPKQTVSQRVGSGGANKPSAEIPKPSISGVKVVGPSKPTGSEMNRADLADNVNENLNQLQDIVTRRPDLFGPGRGWLTTARAFIGTNDPDIAQLEQIKDNLGRAMQGAHGMRAATGVVSAANSVLNSFRNGPNAVGAAINNARRSVQTFITDTERGGDNKDPLGVLGGRKR